MTLPFTIQQFFDVFRHYNETVWPAQFVLVVLALAALALVFRPRDWSGPAIAIILSVLWSWLGLVYHLMFFAAINPLAPVFAAISLAGAGMFLWHGVARRRLRFAWRGDTAAWTGVSLVVFALVVYPVWSALAGHVYPATPTFGLPCPTTVFTIGMLTFLAPPYPRGPLFVPVAWCLVGGQAAVLLDVPPDLGLFVAALVGAALLWRASREGPAHISA